MRRHPIIPRKKLYRGQDRWCVHVPDDLHKKGNKRDYTFTLEKDAKDCARQLTEARKSIFGEFIKLNQEQQAAMFQMWRERKTTQSLTFAKCIQDCLAAKKSSGLRPNSLVALKVTLDSLGVVLGSKAVIAITGNDIEAWLAAHPDWSPKTRLNNLKYASSLFAWAIRKGIVEKNPCISIERPKVPYKGVSILSVSDVKNLLWTTQEHDPALLGFICLVLFGGLRVAESARCSTRNIANGIIDIGGEQTKLNVRRAVKITPQLAAWLAVPRVEIGGKKLNERMKSMASLAGVKLTKNCLRHSFCSYNYAVHGGALTARMANNSETMLARHYLGMVSDEDAKTFSEIMPKPIAEPCQSQN